jgi:hypothetical protein
VTADEQAAASWVADTSPQTSHLLRTRDWALVVDPAASEAVRIAALLHDIDRGFPDPSRPFDPARDWNDPGYLRWHQDRSARIAGDWLAARGAGATLVADVRRIVAAHEDGGFPEADVVQAADSLSFLETMAEATADWVRNGAEPANAEAKLTAMVTRIRIPAARPDAERLLVRALARLPAARR